MGEDTVPLDAERPRDLLNEMFLERAVTQQRRSGERQDSLAVAALDSAALAQSVPGPWGVMPLGEILARSGMEFLVHAWDLAQATGRVAVLEPGLVHDALAPARQLAPLARLSGLIGPECAVPGDADDLTRLLAIFGRHNTGN